MKLFWKIFVSVLISTSLIFFILSYILSVRGMHDEESNLIDKNRIVSDLMSKQIERYYLEYRWPLESLSRLSKDENFFFWWVVRDDNTIHLADKASFVGTSAYSYFPRMKTTGEVFLNHKEKYGIIIKPVTIENKEWYFWLGFSTKQLYGRMRDIVLSIALVSGLALVLLAIVLYSTIGHFLLPVKDLSIGVAAIGKGDLNYRVRAKSGDEIGELGRSFNKMVDDLQKITVSRDELAKEVEGRKKAEEALRESESRYRLLADNATDIIWTSDMNLSFTYFNPSVMQVLGYTIEEMLTKRIEDFLTPDSIQLAGRVLLEEIAKDSLPGADLSRSRMLELQHIRKDGAIIWVEIKISFLRDQAHRPMGILGITRDITERKKAEEALKEYTKKIEQINKELDDFTYIISHDLKEPLRSIDAFSKFLEDDYQEKIEEEGKGYIKRIRANAKRMQSLIEDLLEISRIERKRNPLEEVQAQDLIEEVKLRLEYAIKEKNVEIIIQDNLPKVFCDRVRLIEVFANLISNAIKFNDKPSPKIEVGCNAKDDHYEFFVKDNGPGIEEQYFQKIFEIFQRLGKREDAEGTGAGLTIVKKIIEMHKGKIWVESKVGEYTVFYFTIPKRKQAILGKKKIGEILVEKKLVTEEEIKKALDEQKETG